MATRSQDSYPRGTIVRDCEGDEWRKGTAWWSWTTRASRPLGDRGPGKLLWFTLERMYGPLEVVSIPERKR